MQLDVVERRASGRYSERSEEDALVVVVARDARERDRERDGRRARRVGRRQRRRAGGATEYQPLQEVANSGDLTFGLREGFRFEYFFLPIPPS